MARGRRPGGLRAQIPGHAFFQDVGRRRRRRFREERKAFGVERRPARLLDRVGGGEKAEVRRCAVGPEMRIFRLGPDDETGAAETGKEEQPGVVAHRKGKMIDDQFPDVREIRPVENGRIECPGNGGGR